MIDEFDQNVHFVEIDIEEDPEIAEAAGIMGTPCVQFFKNKENLRLSFFSPPEFLILSFFLFLCYFLVQYCFLSKTYLKELPLLLESSLAATNCFPFLFCRTVPGVKMKSEYREFIEGHK